MALLYLLRSAFKFAVELSKDLSQEIARGCVWLFAARGCKFCANKHSCEAIRYNCYDRHLIVTGFPDGQVKSMDLLEVHRKVSECRRSIIRKHFRRGSWL